MKKNLLIFLLALLPAITVASEGAHYEKAPINLHDTESLQRGAKTFVNYCLSCHSAAYMRYNRMGQDLGISDEQVASNMIFTGAKVGEVMKVAMKPDDAKTWFGITPPDLTVITRARGADYVYTYLRTFYPDDHRPWGVNNKVLGNASMPNVLWQQQATMSEGEFDQYVGDLVNYMVYMAEPAALKRAALGPWVLLFLVVFSVVAYLMKKEYWKDVH
ncbi:cytochrome c1 [Endothiovibrio diazotrophicus]